MNEAQFVRARKPDWDRLEGFAARLDGAGTPLSGEELFGFIALYRKCVGDLARARTLKVRPSTVEYLNGLVGRVHFRIYTTRPYPFSRVVDFYTQTFPCTVRRLRRPVIASTLLLLLPAIAAWLAIRENPHLGSALTPPGYLEQVEKAFGESFGKEQRPAGMAAIMHSFYIVNNVQVSFFAFASGIFVGLGSAFVLAFNGVILGGVGAVIQQYGLSYNFWSFVSSHGGIEMGAIVLAGAAGMHVGLTLLNPGMLIRKEAMAQAAKDAGLVMFGVISMLLLAAMIEAWISPSMLPNPAKIAIGIVNLLAMLAYLGFAGRSGSPRAS